ncbi:unnamed protein product [Onchocerca flexuosa]|uniref:Uncharacterized protein n=1 Tax=Onchocerca flexuosa TaxID=387005 RepID=A0A183H221_9BILA|nr:unnamed protein product [Onchocerca flexuosa]
MPNDLAFNRQYSEEEQSIDMRREGTEEERKMQMDERMLSTAFSFPTEVIEFLSAVIMALITLSSQLHFTTQSNMSQSTNYP